MNSLREDGPAFGKVKRSPCFAGCGIIGQGEGLKLLPYFGIGLLVVFASFMRNLIVAKRSSEVFKSVDSDNPATALKVASKPHQGLAYLTVGVSLIAFAGIRFATGSDYFLYLSLYQALDTSSFTQTVNSATQGVGFATIMFVAKSATAFPYVIFWVASILTVVPILISIKRKSVDPVFALFLYFFLGFYAVSFNAVRQSISVAFLLLADTYRSENKTKYVVLSVLAMLIHSSAIVLVTAQFFVRFWKPTYLSVTTLLVATVPLSYIVIQSGALNAVASALNSRYEAYLLQGDGAGLGTVLRLLVQIGLVFLALSLPKVKDSDRYIAFVCISAVFLYLGLITWVVARLELYFSVFLILLLPNQLAAWRHGKITKWVLAFLLLGYFGMYISSYNQVIPYSVIPELGW